ncbi:MAG: DNA methyltransferase [Anaerolineales bacterium]
MSGASTRDHPAPFPVELATRLVRMFSFYGDTVLDPFCGTGTTSVAALRAGRNSISVDVDAEYCRMTAARLRQEAGTLFSKAHLIFERAEGAGTALHESFVDYTVASPVHSPTPYARLKLHRGRRSGLRTSRFKKPPRKRTKAA